MLFNGGADIGHRGASELVLRCELGPALRAAAPVDNFGLVDLIAKVIGRFQARSLADRAVNVGRSAATAADHVVVIVADPGLKAGRRSGRLNPADQTDVNKDAEHVVHRLERDKAHLSPDGLSDNLGRRMGLSPDGPQDSQALDRNPVALLTKEISRIGNHDHDPIKSGRTQLIEPLKITRPRARALESGQRTGQE
jgi:hypothetical protein